MKALVVYESMYGNTAVIAEAVARSLQAHGLDVAASPVTKIEPVDVVGAGLVVVGGPTHAHGMSRPSTRRAAVDDQENPYPEPTLTPGLRKWMDRLPSGTERLAAAFDTRFDKPSMLTGSAAKGIAKRLERHGYHLVAEPESFFVSTKNHLIDGEIDHAVGWADELAIRVGAIATV
jgi:flavorubredoxin